MSEKNTEFESVWWTVRLPPGYTGEFARGFLAIRAPQLPGVLHLECIRKGSGVTNAEDLQGHCGADPQSCEIGPYEGFWTDSETVTRWAFRQRRSNKALLLRFLKDAPGSDGRAAVEEVLRGVTLK